MKVDITVPGVGESITEGLLASWSVADGSVVIEGQAIFELETDKTTIDITAPTTGTLSISVPEGTDVVINQVVGVIDTDKAEGPEADPETVPKDSDSKPADSISDAPAAVPDGTDAPPVGRITPAAKAAAAEKGIDPASLTGTGRSGMVTKADVAIAAGGEAAGRGASGSGSAPLKVPESSKGSHVAKTGEESAAARQRSSKTLKIGEYRKPLSRIRKIIAANLARTRDELVLLTTFNEADMSAIKTMRARFGEAFKDRYGVKLGFMSFFLKASASALAAYPEVNAYIDGDEVVYRDGIHISVAVSTPKGLVTPVVRHVESRGFAEIEKEIIGFSQKAADKTLMPDDLMGGSFTITNGGIFGSMLSTPLPAPKQSAILGMHAIKERPVALNGEVVIRPMMYLALSYDHRLVDGREAVGCLKSIKEALENPERLLLEV